jgi:hypothetical protein
MAPDAAAKLPLLDPDPVTTCESEAVGIEELQLHGKIGGNVDVEGAVLFDRCFTQQSARKPNQLLR